MKVTNEINRFKSIYAIAIKDTFTPPNYTKIVRQSANRIDFIDLAKGFCILMVCIGHLEVTHILPTQTALLKMPLYFILSGLFFKDYNSIINLIEKKSNKILIPALFFYVIGYLILTLAEFMHSVHLPDGNFFSFFINECIYNPPVWFLFCLFNINVFFCLIYLLMRGNAYLIGLICVICGTLGYTLSINETRLFLFFDCTLSNMPFFFVGWYLKNTKLLIPNKYDNILLVFAIIGLTIIFVIFPKMQPLGLWYAKNIFAGNPLLFYAFAISTVILTLMILKKVKWLPIISYFGRYSLIVLGGHFIIILFTKQFAEKIGGFHTSFITLVLCWTIIPLFKEYMPYFCAQKDLINLKK